MCIRDRFTLTFRGATTEVNTEDASQSGISFDVQARGGWGGNSDKKLIVVPLRIPSASGDIGMLYLLST